MLNNYYRTTRAPASLRKRFATVREEACHWAYGAQKYDTARVQRSVLLFQG